MKHQHPRWIATATYRGEHAPTVVEHHVEELSEVQDLIERGPDWNALVHVNIVLNPLRLTYQDLTVERAEDL
jgi:hypothetical protein